MITFEILKAQKAVVKFADYKLPLIGRIDLHTRWIILGLSSVLIAKVLSVAINYCPTQLAPGVLAMGDAFRSIAALSKQQAGKQQETGHNPKTAALRS